jgi:hypothetical protein
VAAGPAATDVTRPPAEQWDGDTKNESKEIRDFERFLHDSGFSRKEAKTILAGLKLLRDAGEKPESQKSEAAAMARKALIAESLRLDSATVDLSSRL